MADEGHMPETADQPSKPPRTWRPMILSVALIVTGAALVCGVAVNRRRIEAHYWLWQARRAAETGSGGAVPR